MRKFTLIWLVVFVFTSLNAQDILTSFPPNRKAVTWNKDSVYIFIGDQAGGWILTSKQVSIKYNAIGMTTDWYSYVISYGNEYLTDSMHQNYFNDGVTVKEYIRFQQENGQWKDTGQYALFDEQGRILYKIIHLTSQYGTIPASKTYYTYNGDGDLYRVIKFSYDDNANAWVKKYKTEYSYNDTSKLTDSIKQYVWDIVNSIWKNFTKKLYYYTPASGKLYLDSVVYYIYDGTSEVWVPQAKHKYVYTSEGLVCDDYYYYFDKNTNEWVKSNWTTKSYTDTLLQEKKVVFYSDDGSIQGKSKETYSYNEQNLLIERITYDYDFDKQEYVPHSQYLYQYNDDGLVTEYITKYWDRDLSQWKNAGKTEYYLSKKTYSGLAEAQLNIKVYPNPASDYVIVSGLDSRSKVELITLDGHILKRLTGQKRVILFLNGLEPGYYLIKVYRGNDFYARKILKL